MVDTQLKIDNEHELNEMPPIVSSLSLTLGGICFCGVQESSHFYHRL